MHKNLLIDFINDLQSSSEVEEVKSYLLSKSPDEIIDELTTLLDSLQ